mgnify:CR=1 FL=1
MPKTAPIPRCCEEDRKTLGNWAGSRTLEARLVERATANYRRASAGVPAS